MYKKIRNTAIHDKNHFFGFYELQHVVIFGILVFASMDFLTDVIIKTNKLTHRVSNDLRGFFIELIFETKDFSK